MSASNLVAPTTEPELDNKLGEIDGLLARVELSPEERNTLLATIPVLERLREELQITDFKNHLDQVLATVNAVLKPRKI